MEGLVLFVVSLVGLALFVAPVLSLVGFLRVRAMRSELARLGAQVQALERHVAAQSARPATSSAAPGDEATAPPLPVPPVVSEARPASAPVETPSPPTVSAGPPPATTPAPDAVSGTPAQVPASPTPPPIPEPPSLPPTSSRLPPTSSSLPPIASVPPFSESDASSGPPPKPPGPPAPPVPSPQPRFDWESMLGIRGAAWLGGVTLVIAALFFAKWSIDQGFFTPAIRVALMLLAGTGALVWAELELRQGFQTTANAVSGAGVVTLYVAFFAGHSLYQLIALPIAFGGMSIVTLVAGVIAIRYRAFFTAVIGLSGGLATPVLLSTGVDRPVAFFSYLALLAVGFLFVAERRAWWPVTILALAGTTALELAWHVTYMTPTKLVVGVIAYAVLGAAFLWHAVRTRKATGAIHPVAVLGSFVPFGFAVLVAADARFVQQWVIVAGFLTVIDAGLIVAAVRWRLPIVVGASAVATALSLHTLGGTHAQFPDGLWGLTAVAITLSAAFVLLPALARPFDADWLAASQPLALVTSTAVLAGLLAFAWWTSEGGHLPVGAFIAVTACALWATVERTREDRWPGAFAAGVLLIAITSAHWVAVTEASTYLDRLAVPHMVAAAVAVVAAWRHRDKTRAGDWWQTDHAAVVAAAAVAYWSATAGLDFAIPSRAAQHFALLGLDVALVLAVAIRASWTGLVPATAMAVVVFVAAWHARYFSPATAPASVTAYLAAYALFLGLPFVIAGWWDAAWKTRPAPWLSAALIGPALFLVFYDSWIELAGKAWVGIVPVLMAAVSVAGLYGISRYFVASPDDPDAKRRLNYLALFAAIALGFIATAVPLQLERQWITIGWALEAAAVWWLFGLLPHPGLKYFGLSLYLAIGLRLLANPEVLRYEPRGLPILNWLLYTYGIPAACCLAGAWLLPRAETRRGASPDWDYTPRDRTYPAPLVGLIGVLVVFWLINLEIADYYSAGRYVEFDWTRHLARDLTRSFAWGLYALVLLGVGLWRVSRGLRLVSLAFLLLTVGKVFLYDLGQLTGLYRIVSFLALGLSLILVSLLYQRFVRRAEASA